MVAERPLDRLLLGGIDIAFDHEIAVGRHLDPAGQTAHQLHGTPAQESRQQVFVHVVGHRRRRGIRIDGIAAQRDGHGHPPPLPPVAVVVACAGLVHVPVHTGRAVVENLHPVHPHVAHPRIGVERMHHRQRNEAPAVLRPAFEHRQQRQSCRLAPQHHLLAGAASASAARHPARHFAQQRQHPQLLPQGRFGCRHFVQQRVDAPRQPVERLHAQRQRHTAFGAHEVGHHRKVRPRAFEEDRLSAAGLLGHAVGQFGDLLHGRHLGRDTHQLAFAFEPFDKFAQIIVGHGFIFNLSVSSLRTPRRAGAQSKIRKVECRSKR